MLGWYVQVATTQGKNEVARIAEATESEEVASKTACKVSASLHETERSKKDSEVSGTVLVTSEESGFNAVSP